MAGFAAVSPRVFAIVIPLLVAGFAPVADAQERREPQAETHAGSNAGSDADADTEVDPASGRRFRTVRPEGLLRRGALSVDTAIPLVVAAALAVLAGLLLTRALWSRRK